MPQLNITSTFQDAVIPLFTLDLSYHDAYGRLYSLHDIGKARIDQPKKKKWQKWQNEANETIRVKCKPKRRQR